MTDEHDHMRWRAHATLNSHTDKSANVLLRCACNSTSTFITFDDRTVCMINTVHSASSSENKNHSRGIRRTVQQKWRTTKPNKETQDTLCTHREWFAAYCDRRWRMCRLGRWWRRRSGTGALHPPTQNIMRRYTRILQQPEITRRTPPCTCTYVTKHTCGRYITSRLNTTKWCSQQ